MNLQTFFMSLANADVDAYPSLQYHLHFYSLFNKQLDEPFTWQDQQEIPRENFQLELEVHYSYSQHTTELAITLLPHNSHKSDSAQCDQDMLYS